jgi:Fe-Mn family superoxide dismutase
MAAWGSARAADPAAPVPPKAVVQLPALPYAENALEPVISARTLGFHYGKHHKGYLDNLNKLIAVSELESMPLEEIIKVTSKTKDKDGVAIFNNAAQVWNHTFFWSSMKPNGGGKPGGALLEKIEKSFGSYEKFRQAFVDAAMGQFGSGWVWLVADPDGLKIIKTSNADTPVAHGQKALITCDVWEHAYYLDYQNRRKDFVAAFLDSLVNWEFASAQLAK